MDEWYAPLLDRAIHVSGWEIGNDRSLVPGRALLQHLAACPWLNLAQLVVKAPK